ncbi:DUF5694 domain-containing protein [Candidatus Poribacteria bacterium]
MTTDDEQFAFPDQPKARIMLLGTFHFKDAGLDHYKPQFDVDILSEKRQQEVAEVVELLEAFQPTRIAVECRLCHQEELDRSYSTYLRGELLLSAGEVHQLGFRLAKRLGHSKLYCVDALGCNSEPPVDLDEYAREHGQEHLLSQWLPRFEKLLELEDELKIHQTLRETLLRGNSEDAIMNGHGAYLVDYFKIGVGDEYPGVDWVTSWWYNRNLRIFANLQRITGTPSEKILLIIGGGHTPILRHCVLASPEYDLVEVHEYL